MYKTRVPIHELAETVDRPILVTVVNDVKKLLGIDHEVKYMIGDNETDRVVDVLGNIRDHSSPRTEVFLVNSIEDSTNDEDLSLLVNNPGNKPFFIDADIQSRFTTLNHSRTTTVTIKYHNKSKSKLTTIANKLRLMTSSDSMYRVHDLNYYYNIPSFPLSLMYIFNEMKNRYLDTKLTYDEYIFNNLDNRADIVNSANGDPNKTSIAIREVQVGVLGNIVTELANIKAEHDDSTESWFIEFEYRFTYQKPVSILLEYPLTIYNRPIPKQYRIKPKFNTPGLPLRGPRLRESQDLMDFVFKDLDTPIFPTDGSYYLKLPIEDNLELPKPTAYTTRLFSVVSIVDPNNPTELFALDELPNVGFKKNILKLLEKEKDFISDRFKSIFHFELFNFDKQVFNNRILSRIDIEEIEFNGKIEVRKRFKLYTEKPLDMSGNYRVGFNMLLDFSILSKDTKARLNKHLEEVDEAILVDLEKELEDKLSNGFVPLTLTDRLDKFILSLNMSRKSDRDENHPLVVNSITPDDAETNITIDTIVDEFHLFGLHVDKNITTNDLAAIMQNNVNLIKLSSLFNKINKCFEYNGIFLKIPTTLNDIINVIAINPKAIKRYDPREKLTNITDIEVKIVENVYERIFTKQYTTLISSLMERKEV